NLSMKNENLRIVLSQNRKPETLFKNRNKKRTATKIFLPKNTHLKIINLTDCCFFKFIHNLLLRLISLLGSLTPLHTCNRYELRRSTKIFKQFHSHVRYSSHREEAESFNTRHDG